jgi:flagellar protein FliO/FliZ
VIVPVVLAFLAAAAPPGQAEPSGAPPAELGSPVEPAPADPAPNDAVDAVGALDLAARTAAASPSTAKVEPPPPPLPEPPRELPSPSLGMGDLLGQLVKMILMLGVVVGLAYLTLNKGLGKLVERQNLGKRVKVVERVALDAKRSLFLVDLDGKQMLLGAGEGGVVFIRDVDPTAATAANVPPPKAARFTDTLKRAVGEHPVTTGLAKAVEDKTA